MGIRILQRLRISIHPPRGGWDLHLSTCVCAPCYFNPPTPWGVGLTTDEALLSNYLFQSTHPVGGGTGDPEGVRRLDGQISIHPPRGGWDAVWIREISNHWPFQSTHPVGGGTSIRAPGRASPPISIHPPRGGWDRHQPCMGLHPVISIHPPRGGWDLPYPCSCTRVGISIHPPRGGWDGRTDQSLDLRNISIHPPRGGWDGFRG